VTLPKRADSEKPLLLVQFSEEFAITSNTGPQSTSLVEEFLESFASLFLFSSSSFSGFFSVSIVNSVLMMLLASEQLTWHS